MDPEELHMNPRFVQLVSSVKPQIQEITPQDVQAKIESKEPFYLIDVREVDEFRQGHIENANHISKGVLELTIENLTNDPNAEIVLYCGGGNRSALAADALQKMGYKNVQSMEGGLGAWHRSGYLINVLK